MYVYRILNKINGKSYIGSTNSPERRKNEHFNSAKWQSCQSYNYPLQKAIRKYGEENFIFSILEECDKEFVAEKERHYIELYNTLTNTGYGYNQTIETECALRDEQFINQHIERTGIKCALVDNKNNIVQTFNSYHDAARTVLGIDEGSIIRKVCNGENYSCSGHIFRRLKEDGTVEIPKQKTRKRKTAIYGISINNPNDIVYYESVSEAARQENIERSSLSKCINGSTKYSKVKNRIWKKAGEDNE